MPTPTVGAAWVARAPAIVTNPTSSLIVISSRGACYIVRVWCLTTHHVPPTLYLLALERRIEGDGGRGEVGAADKGQRVGRAPVAVHARIFPFNRERPLVADAV